MIRAAASPATVKTSHSVPAASNVTARIGTISVEQDLDPTDYRIVVESGPFENRFGAPEREEDIRQPDGRHAPGQVGAGQLLEHRGPETSGEDVVLQSDGRPMGTDPLGEARIERLDPTGIDHGRPHPLLEES